MVRTGNNEIMRYHSISVGRSPIHKKKAASQTLLAQQEEVRVCRMKQSVVKLALTQTQLKSRTCSELDKIPNSKNLRRGLEPILQRGRKTFQIRCEARRKAVHLTANASRKTAMAVQRKRRKCPISPPESLSKCSHAYRTAVEMNCTETAAMLHQRGNNCCQRNSIETPNARNNHKLQPGWTHRNGQDIGS
jgi:hypothetical protein